MNVLFAGTRHRPGGMVRVDDWVARVLTLS